MHFQYMSHNKRSLTCLTFPNTSLIILSYLQVLTSLAAKCPCGNLRYQYCPCSLKVVNGLFSSSSRIAWKLTWQASWNEDWQWLVLHWHCKLSCWRLTVMQECPSNWVSSFYSIILLHGWKCPYQDFLWSELYSGMG